MSECARRAALAVGSKCLCSVLDHDQVMRGGNSADSIHVAGRARIVHHKVARVREVAAGSIAFGSILSVSGSISTNTGTAPRRTTALAVDTKVKDGMITSSPGFRSHRMAAISNAAVLGWELN